MKIKTIVATLLGLVLAVGLISLAAPAASAKKNDDSRVSYCQSPGKSGKYKWIEHAKEGEVKHKVEGITSEADCLALNNPKPQPTPEPTETTPEPEPSQTEDPEPEPTKTEQPTPTPTESTPEPEPTKTEGPAPTPTETTTPTPTPTATESTPPVDEEPVEEPVTEPTESPAPPAEDEGDDSPVTDVCVEQGLSFDYTTGECFKDWSEQVEKRTGTPKAPAKALPTKSADVTTMDSLPRTGPSENALVAGLGALLIASGAGLRRLARVKG